MNVGLIIPALQCEQTLCDLLGWVDCPELNGLPPGWHAAMNREIGMSFRKVFQAAHEACETQLITQLQRWESAARKVASTIAHNPGITLATWAVVGPRDDLDAVRDAVAKLQQISCGEVETVNESPSTEMAKACLPTRRRGRLSKDEKKARIAQLLAILVDHPTMFNEPTEVAERLDVHPTTARKWLARITARHLSRKRGDQYD